MFEMMRLVLIASLCSVAACDVPPAPQPMNVGPIPKKICAEMANALAKIAETTLFEYSLKGEAIMPQDAWLSLPPGQKDQIAQLLAFHAACQAENAPSEQKVTVRSETGDVLLDRIVETRPDLSELLVE